jgi:hypothetical protein
MTDESPAPPTVFVIDDLTARPGQGEALQRAYRERYAPGAARRGLMLVHELVSPPYWLPDGENRLLFVWSARGPAGVWAAKHAGRPDPEVVAWWTEEAPRLVASRSRAICASAADLAGLGDV